MSELIEILEKRKRELNALLPLAKVEVNVAPPGHLRISMEKNKPHFYHVTEKNDTRGKYIKKKEHEILGPMAQREYNKNVTSYIIAELTAIDKMIFAAKQYSFENVYERMHEVRKSLVIPVKQTDEQFVAAWVNTPFTGMPINDTEPYQLTDRGERVRSKSENMIANCLYKHGIPYKYECPVMINGRNVYIDFTVLNVRKRRIMYWEHFGMMNDPEYADNVVFKLDNYQRAGIILGDNLIATFEKQKCALNSVKIEAMIEKFLL